MSTDTADYEELLEDCLRLHEEFENAAGMIDLLLYDLESTVGEIRGSLETIEHRIGTCEAGLNHLVSAKTL